MQQLIKVWNFAYQHQLLTVRAQMEAEGIQTYTRNELTIQVDPLYSNALGGIELMVREEDADRAREILAEAGFVEKDTHSGQALNRVAEYINNLTIFGNLSFERRVYIITATGVVLLAFLLYLLAINT